MIDYNVAMTHVHDEILVLLFPLVLFAFQNCQYIYKASTHYFFFFWLQSANFILTAVIKLRMPLVIPLKQTTDIDLTKPVSSFLRNTFSELGSDAAIEMARSFDQQRRVACVKGFRLKTRSDKIYIFSLGQK